MVIRTVIFYVLTFFFTIALGATLQALGGSEASVPQLGPGLAALVLIPVFRESAKRLKIRQSLGMPDLRRAVIAFVLPFAVAVPIFVISGFAVGGLTLQDALPLPFTLVGLLWIPFGAFGEELGWRGYLHKTLDPKLRGIVSSLVVGVLWALWHVQLYGNGPVYMIFLVILMISYSAVIYVLVRDRFNVWVATLFHIAVNVSNLAYFGLINETPFMMVNALVWAVIAGIVVYLNREEFFGERAMEVPSLALEE